ncbi:phosphohydrolase [Thermosipho melanesiensis]|uniref:Metal dependent phosphohydrolase n=2 Tax=Thermosipho melanesiensis TaxID=46541 RepID=A6LMA7_THEM4|nr:HD domain-containing phosphohydrolase [Thermosipho melanesiensis]ABR31058.1 metal dependent phosphohydrolase [Thermosipho melanesiensis BI429]APT74152.1 phosphohydrolase [Thermosipho melanesiensis]OOC36098.1 phosphohydrolase [Thermosipho melanesiensis]OOC36915.1 phosphohydrolase [Thermosipho melanesiensis]OOC37666.1 phosphohydrolase [Thermosipho melanesiensis]
MNLNTFIQKKINKQLIFPFIILAIVSGIFFMSIGFRTTITTSKIELEKAVEKWNNTFTNMENFLEFLSYDNNLIDNTEKLGEILKNFYNKFQNKISYIYFSTSSKNILIYPETDMINGINPNTRPWFINASKNKEKTQITEPYVDHITKDIIITISKYVNGMNISGVIGIDINPSFLNDILSNKDLLLISKNNIILFSENKNKIGKTFNIPTKSERFISKNILLITKEAKGNVYIVTYKNLFLELLPYYFISLVSIFLILFLGKIVNKNINTELKNSIAMPLETLVNEAKNYLNNQTFDSSKITSNIKEIEVLINEIADMISIIEANFQELKATNEELLDAYNEIEKYSGELESTYELFIEKMSNIVEGFDENTGNHIKRVQILSEFLAKKLGLPKTLVRQIYLYSPLHDIGKIKVPPEILTKPGPLSEKEWKIMKNHTIWGAEILDGDPRLEIAKKIALYHHEKYNGKGYPFGLKGELIPIEAQIVNIVDVYDALRSKRPYKKALSHEKAMEIILKGDNRTSPNDFNPKILEIFKKYEEEIKILWDNLNDNK